MTEYQPSWIPLPQVMKRRREDLQLLCCIELATD